MDTSQNSSGRGSGDVGAEEGNAVGWGTVGEAVWPSGIVGAEEGAPEGALLGSLVGAAEGLAVPEVSSASLKHPLDTRLKPWAEVSRFVAVTVAVYLEPSSGLSILIRSALLVLSGEVRPFG
tara:strand:+ start:275 stop:640 length:366 start_codon:yes stop_codon:yes gene_type:complete